MHIQQIEIDNFKSFSNRTVIPFQEGFTTISGPNGSGKSNIIDSILFCLGLSSSRTMRAEKLTDLINNASRRREAIVTILFGQHPDEGNDKIVVSRKIKDNGASGYGSTYYLDGRVSTLTEIHDRLSHHHISPGAYNVLMQGDVTGIINMSPLERRRIIDEIAGVAEFDRKIEQAQKELESVSGSIERFQLLLGELQTRLEQLAQERDQALKYQKLKEEKQHFEELLITARFLDLKKAVQAAEQSIVNSRKQKTTVQQQIAQLEKQIAATREELNKVAAEVKRKGEDQQIALKKQIEGLKGAAHRKKDTIQFSAQKKQENLRASTRINDEIARVKDKITDLDTTLEGLNHQQQEVEKKHAQENSLLEAHQNKLSSLLDSTGELGTQRNDLRSQLEAAQDDLSRLQREKLDIEAERDRQTREREYQATKQASTGGRLQEITEQKTKLEKALADSDFHRQAFEKQIQNQQLAVIQLRSDLNQATGDMNRVHREHAQLEAQKRAYEDVNFGRAVDTILNAGLNGVHGTLAQLCQVDDDYALALEIAMGARLRNIVVQDDRIAESCIAYLQQQRAGRATFLPLDKIRSGGQYGRLPNSAGIVDYAINLIDFDSCYQEVFRYALGETLIVEDMASARPYLRQFRMVTVDGSLLEKTGAMTGGSTSNQGTGMLGGNKVEKQITALHKQLEKLDAERDKLEKKLTQAEIKLDALKQDYAQHLTEQQQNQLTLDALMRELGQLSTASGKPDALSNLDKTIAALNKQYEQLESETFTAETAVSRLSDALNAIDAQLPTEQLEGLKTEMEHITFQLRAYETQLRNIQNDCQSRQLEKEFQEKGIQSHLEQIEQLKQQNIAIDKEKDNLLEEIELLDKQINALEAQTSELDEELQRLQAERDVVQAKLIEEEQQKYNFNREINLIDEQILAFQARKCELQPEIQRISQELLEAGMDPDSITQTDLPDAATIQEEILKIGRKMDAMGNVNMRAIVDYDEVMSRHAELSDKINTLTHEREALGIKISGYGELKLNAFRRAFENVDYNFREIFAELSDGEGGLILTNPDDPFAGGLTIEARPRDKKTIRLEAMSGGEKSLTALALVFAFQRYMPAPFYALDEVDMSLDGINAEKLASMVRRQAEVAQFIVISHRKPMLQCSDRTLGVTQKRDGISRITGVILQHAS